MWCRDTGTQRVNDAGNLKLAPGETTTWADFRSYADAIAANGMARRHIGLITSHGFGKVYDAHGVDTIREARPDLHAWTTSTSWLRTGGTGFAMDFADEIYGVKLNGLIPWAIIQRSPFWPQGDPNPNPPFLVKKEADSWKVHVREPYFYYKQLTRAGQPGTAVAEVQGGGDAVKLMAFADNGSGHGDALVVVNGGGEPEPLQIGVSAAGGEFYAYRTSPSERCAEVGEFAPQAGTMTYEAPPESVTTFLTRPQP